MKKTSTDFSIILATYTGVDSVSAALRSLLDQEETDHSFELIIIIDGPNDELRKKIDEVSDEFESRGMQLSITQFKRNKGRFEARLYGARKAKYGQLLIMDDRIVLPKDFLKDVSALNELAVMPDVEEAEAKNLVSMTLNRIRRRAYGRKWGTDFESYYIDSSNFDASPKGTAAFWVNKDVFLRACEKIAKDIAGESRNISDDTKVLMEIVSSGTRIYKTSRLKLVYKPRSSAWEETRHIFQRGPKFVDYYLHPGRRFFLPLTGFYIALIALVALIIFYPPVLLLLLAVSLLAAIYLTDKANNLWRIWLGCLMISLSFGLGLVRGLFKAVL